MATHANKTYINNGGTLGYNSVFADGDAAPPSTGLKLVGTVAHGNTVKILAGSDINFGDDAPDFYFIYRMENMTAGSNLVLTRGTTFDDGEYMCRKKRLSYTSATQMPVHTVAGMPYNKGMPYGDLAAYPSGSILNPKMETFATRKYSSFYRFSYMYWPAANQANQLANSVLGEQVKFCGDQFEDGFSLAPVQTKADAYQGIYSPGSVLGTMSSSAALVTSNSGSFGGSQTSDLGAVVTGGQWYFPTVTNNAAAVVSTGITFPANTNMNIYVDSTHQRSSVMCYETFIVSGATDIHADVRLVDTTLGVVADIHDSGVTNPLCTNKKFDRFDTPKNVQGMNVPDNKHFYASGIMQLVSDIEGVASCRVMIANTSSPTKDTTFLSCCIHSVWSNKMLVIEIVEGLFWDQSLSGKYLHVYGAFNAYIGSILIP